ncbi:POK6 protein, partial [Piaya cayana]|nr:POK6 protein [Piaya cayana]NWH82999.1 POK6 protein [Piaya cayana]
YLGWKIREQTIKPQQVKHLYSVKTLNDVQKLLGPINWVCPLIGITTGELHT